MTAPRAPQRSARRASARLAVLAGALLAVAPAAHAQRVADRLADLRLATAVRLALVEDARTRMLDLDVAARDGGVEVSGNVPAADRQLVAEVVRAVPGVRVVGGLGAAADRAGSAWPRSSEPPEPQEMTNGALERPPERVGPLEPRRSPELAATPPGTTGRSAKPAPASGPLYHTVERGDTLFSLARRYGTSVEAIRALNGRPSDGIRVGQRLRVR